MLAAEPALKRSSSSLSEHHDAHESKRPKRPYHHHHRLQNPVAPAIPEPAITDDAYVDHLMNRSIGLYLRDSGFEIADPTALDSFRNATEEYVLKFASYIRQSMLSSRRIQPIPHDFEHAMNRHRVRVDDLLPHLKPRPDIKPTPTLLQGPLAESDDDFKSLPSFGPQLSGEDDRVRRAHIPRHFPEFPSKHTYLHTPVFTEREQDPRKIRERATEDGRHGEEALRKLARAAFKDNQLGSSGHDKKLWGRIVESMDSMFEKTVKAVSKKNQKNATGTGAAGAGAPMEIDFGTAKPPRNKVSLNIDLPPIINCERDLWRKSTVSGSRRIEEKIIPKLTTT